MNQVKVYYKSLSVGVAIGVLSTSFFFAHAMLRPRARRKSLPVGGGWCHRRINTPQNGRLNFPQFEAFSSARSD